MKLLILVATILALTRSEDVRDLFRQAMAKYARADGILKSESPTMMEKRFRSFLKFHAMVEEVNNDDSLPYTAADNFMSVLTEEERMLRLGLNITGHEFDNSDDNDDINLLSRSNIPDKRDFSQVISDIKDQSTCGSCWTFGATGALEGEIYFATGNKKVNLAEREYMECVNTKKDACDGGWPTNCYTYSRNTGRIAPTSAYPYATWDRRKCHADASTPNALEDNNVQVTGYTYTGQGDVKLLEAAASHIISVAIYANGYFMGYDKGMYIDSRCQDSVNHAVNVVGYGVHSTGRKYWKIRNSWGRYWGESGYMFMDREKENMCQISKYPHIPKVMCRKFGACTAPNPDDGDSSGDEEDEEEEEDQDDNSSDDFTYDDVCWTKRYFSTCMKKLKKAKYQCEVNPDQCILAKIANKCHLGTNEGTSGNNYVEVPSKCSNDPSAIMDTGCREKSFLSGCLKTMDAAVKACEKEVEASKCLIVRQNKCFYATTTKTSGSRWIERPVKCEEECNSAAGMVLCSDCNCCKHKHMCADTNRM